MAETLLKPGDEIDVVVTFAKPFGLLVETDTGLSGLVRGARAEAGATLRVRVLEYDAVESRFSATLAA
jgi:ribosomal protein S1